MTTPDRLRAVVGGRLGRLGDVEKAEHVAAYMKSGMPFYGVTKSDRAPVLRLVIEEFPPGDAAEYRANTLALWSGEHREESIWPIGLRPCLQRVHQVGAGRPLPADGGGRRLGGTSSTRSPATSSRRGPGGPSGDASAPRAMDRRLRPVAPPNRHPLPAATQGANRRGDAVRLLRAPGHEKEFFIRKAIGWALGEYAKTDSSAVRRFLDQEAETLSGPSRPEASKHL